MRLNGLSFWILISANLGSATTIGARRSCRCSPSESCWPSESEWDSLNRTTNGQVDTLKPVGEVCHGSIYNSRECHMVNQYSNSSIWRTDHPAALIYTNWEALPQRNESCFVGSKRSVPCGQGRVPLYTVEAKTPQDIQAGVNFARHYNLRLAIRNTGHSYQGRSTAPDSLQINTHAMKNKTLHKNFTPSGYNGTGKIEPFAVTLDAGVQLYDMYKFCSENSVMVVGGSSHGVGAAGGFIQGGGHSMFAGLLGMASDNALEFKVVVSDGRHVIANAYQNSDLFWALRGGGGGTFGVVTSVTVRAIPEPPIVSFKLVGEMALASDAYWNAVEHLNSFIPEYNEAGGTMYYYLNPNYPSDSGKRVSQMHIFGGFPNKTSRAEVRKFMKPFVDKLGHIAGKPLDFNVTYTPKAADLFTSEFGTSDLAGVHSILGSRLLTRDLLKSHDGPKRIANTLRSLKVIPGKYDTISGIVTVGPQVWANTDIDSALHPVWRETQLHLVIMRPWLDTTPFVAQEVMQKNLTYVEVPMLKKLDLVPKGGAYLNEADAYDPEFKETFWGPNYPRLYQIKQKWDPEGLFIVRTGVGSEDWDDEGLCPK
ncbi:hypothetical protein BDV26DRAFT_303295 [Aspergillus bertholletiae]|uniref:FAD-binding PCMH-type domain-containing protein n=1 Tax=Aspergillus bertholletiae TaxID=1226010 RepID=A0A5N7AMI6_9EURO|nr:hypothetical protein BDV26DRAFT_303295 [Aspergillus bertholletiae]